MPLGRGIIGPLRLGYRKGPWCLADGGWNRNATFAATSPRFHVPGHTRRGGRGAAFKITICDLKARPAPEVSPVCVYRASSHYGGEHPQQPTCRPDECLRRAGFYTDAGDAGRYAAACPQAGEARERVEGASGHPRGCDSRDPSTGDGHSGSTSTPRTEATGDRLPC